MKPLDYFRTLVTPGPGGDGIPLTEAALAISQDVYPQLDLDAVQSDIDRHCALLHTRIPATATPLQRLRALNRFFFGELGFEGNRNDYYDPDNSYLNRVLERRRGIPISLGVLYMEFGQQIGLALQGVSFPGHFLVKLSVRGGDVFLDPYSGQPQSRTQLEARLSQFIEIRDTDLSVADALAPALSAAPPHDILVRMLRNLKSIYHDRREFERLLCVQERLVVLRPDVAHERRDRGLILAQLDCPRAAIDDLTLYLESGPPEGEADEIRHTLEVLRDAARRLN